ncbi:CBS domain-containing protein [Actinosynnema pretiosum subsp. pretiosum]|uniref:CBS domain-containing protein n=2 Tax=Actinosynnema TaxID=40566 RepID=A0AA45L594_9PSEU|nr:CBS domain-containing protein [Actinosynnema mirum]ACU38968.1 putative signal transduction protein with CBS domains [Actinosynnema mirum DSM 43827]AXX32561.1 CBS domain protein [Actinosynnema pretiosum subsp. pretiosum]QUF03536.1 CBS domain-containing protein [Actinosynnema pretiosum subsp. pretiosum]
MTTAREIMHAGVMCVQDNQTLEEAAVMMRDMKVGSLPICGSDDKLKGIITDRDIVISCVAAGISPADMRAGQLARNLHWVDADTDITDVLETMEVNQIRRIPVLENHRLVGMVSESDLAKHLDDDQLAEFIERVYSD